MDEVQKRTVVIVIAVLAVIAAVYSAYRVMTADQLKVGVVHPSPAKSLKQLEMERQAKEDSANKSGKETAETEDAALSGAPPR